VIEARLCSSWDCSQLPASAHPAAKGSRDPGSKSARPKANELWLRASAVASRLEAMKRQVLRLKVSEL
jgi:hypothetical protein